MKNRNAFTLIEVLAALALLVSATVVLLAAQQRSLALLKEVSQQEMVDHLARELITEWKLQPASFRPPAEGSFSAKENWRWTRREEPLIDKDSHLRRVTLQIVRIGDAAKNSIIAKYAWVERSDGK